MFYDQDEYYRNSFLYDDDDYNYNNHNDEAGAAGAIIIFILAILSVPAIPAGDIAIYLLNIYYKDISSYIYFLAWLITGIIWCYLCFKLLKLIFDKLWVIILLLYIQGIIFALLLANTKYGFYSKIIYSIFKLIFIGKD